MVFARPPLNYSIRRGNTPTIVGVTREDDAIAGRRQDWWMPVKSPAQIALTYASVSAIWILLSDGLLRVLVPEPRTLALAGAVKGWCFVAVTAALLYGMMRRMVQRLTTLDATLARQQSEALRTAQLLEILSDSSTDAIYVKDAEGRYLLFNQAAGRFVGHPPAEVLGQDDRTLFPADEALQVMASDRRLMQGGVVATIEETVSTVQGPRTFLATKGPFYDSEGRLAGLFGISHDITDRKNAEDVERRLNRALRLLSSCNMALVRADSEDDLLDRVCRLIVDKGGYRMAWVGYALDDAAQTIRPVCQRGFEAGYLERARITWAEGPNGNGPAGLAIRTGRTQVNQDATTNPAMAPWRQDAIRMGFLSSIALPLRDGTRAFGLLSLHADRPNAFFPDEIALLEELAGDLAFDIATLRARQDKAAAEERLAFLNAHDPLTGLPKRVLAEDRLELAIAMAHEGRGKAALMYIDIDHFKTVNESLGHHGADAVLCQVAQRLTATLSETQTASRHGGDEFLVVIPDAANVDAIAAQAAAVLEALSRPFEASSGPLTLSASIGVALYPEDGTDFETLLRNADRAMYDAKDRGRNAVSFFDARMTAGSSRRLRLRRDLYAALERQEFRLHYQPKLDLTDNLIVGAEALLRWEHPDLGLVAPNDFIPLAEENGLIVPIGDWVIREGCRQLVHWRDQGLVDLSVAVNLSGTQFRRGDLVASVRAALAESGLDPARLELELTESILIGDTAAVLATIGGLKDLGVRLSIDDFGTGYSSLAYLTRFRVDSLKIDQSFVTGLADNAEADAIVRTIVQMAGNLGMTTIAEGVETAETLSRLRAIGCHLAQGFRIARPLPAAAFEQFVRG
jgi:diguanylate cyclase (GGDEF)-like protein/PAS domain S-box-containing protein